MKISKSEISLELNCWVDELSPAQMEKYEKVANEHNEIKNALKNALNNNDGKELFNGEVFSAYSFKGKVLQEIKEATLPKKPPKPTTDSLSRTGRKRIANFDYLESTDEEEEEDLPLAKRAVAPSRGRLGRPPGQTHDNTKTATSAAARAGTRHKTSGYGKSSPSLNVSNDYSSGKDSPVAGKNSKYSSKTSTSKMTVGGGDKVASQNFRPSEITSVGGLVIGGDGKDNTKTTGESKEIKLQGKTFPSLVVLAKPWLKVKDMSSTRSKLDSKVKLVLMLTPNKFTEWLIQEGLLKSEQRCTNHRNTELKLGVYSDATKFPYTGGYVWISECCPMRFVSVFHGSLFEGAPHPPSCILKLIYHWSCQTNIQNVVQWVKVDNVYIKGVYTWLRAACTLAIHQKCKILGGPDRYVEVGVISLGTTSQDGQQRQVKVEVLGVLDYTEKSIRLRAVEPVSDADRNYKKRFQTILEPLSRWVDKESIIAIDLTVDKMTLYQMGFKNIVQAAANDNTAKHTNSSVMDYLRRIVPRMFQNTLSLLSRQMIQQFLDELVWREQFGTYALQAFNNITTHLAEQTRMNTSETLTQRLYQVATNPFKDWSTVPSSKDTPPPATTPKRLKKPINEADYNPPQTKSIKKEPNTSTPGGGGGSTKRSRSSAIDEDYRPEKKSKYSAVSSGGSNMISNTNSGSSSSTNVKKPTTEMKVIKKDFEDDQNGLEEMYYGVRHGGFTNFESFPYKKGGGGGGDGENDENYDDNNIALYVECPVCDTKETFDSNDKLQTHLVSHIVIDEKDHQFQCLFCLEKHASESVLSKHNQLMHPTGTKSSNSSTYHCLICQLRFSNINLLASHLQRVHNVLELPYHCQACGYSSSSHRDLVRHFYDDHKSHNFLQCPFCLEIFRFSFKGELKISFIEAYYMHLRSHITKKDATSLRCQKCALSFCDKGLLKQHLVHHHVGNAKNPYGIRQMVNNTAFIGLPKTKSHHREPIPYTLQTKFGDFYAFVENGYICAECNVEIINENHFIGLMKCNKCLYKTCCERAMFAHSILCQNSSTKDSTDASTFDKEIHCICGYSTSSGNAMAHHLNVCGQKSAYPSTGSAQENTVKKNMLDMLGLMRRDGEMSSVEGGDETSDNIEQQQQQREDQQQQQEQQQLQITLDVDETTLEQQQQALADAIIYEDPQDDEQQQISSADIDMPLIGEISEPNPSSTPPPSFIGEVHTPMFNADYNQQQNQ